MVRRNSKRTNDLLAKGVGVRVQQQTGKYNQIVFGPTGRFVNLHITLSVSIFLQRSEVICSAPSMNVIYMSCLRQLRHVLFDAAECASCVDNWNFLPFSIHVLAEFSTQD